MTEATPIRVGFDVSRIAERLASAKVHGELFPVLFRELLRQLAAGRPVSPLSLAKALEWPTTTVVETLAKARGVEYDAQGSVVGYGLTLKETPHALEVNGQSLFTWCALDTLFFPALLEMSARVSSRCAVTGAPVSIVVSPHEVRETTPTETMLSLVQPDDADSIRHAFCRHVQFIASRQAARQWASANSGTVLVSVLDAFRLGQDIARRL